MNKINKKLKNYRINKNEALVLGVKINPVSLPKAVSLIKNWVKSNKQYQITTPNPEHIVLALNDYRFKEILNNSSLSIADGVGLVWALKLLQKGSFLRAARMDLYKLSGVDLMAALCKLAAKNNWRVFLLGGKSDVAKKAAHNIKKQFSIFNSQFSINYYAGAKDIKQESKQEKQTAIKKINQFKPHLLFVSYGAPWQEKWIYNNLKKLNVKVAMGVGGAFDYLAGRVKRAPKPVRKIGIEWLWRLLYQPWRLKRQLALLKFGYLVIRERIERISGHQGHQGKDREDIRTSRTSGKGMRRSI